MSGYYADDYHGPAGDIPVQVFSKVKRGTATGHSTGPHLTFTARQDRRPGMTISKLYEEASRRYRFSSYTYAVSGAIAGAVLIFSLLSFDHTAVNMLFRGALAILVVMDFAMTVRCTNKADQSKALAEKWRNL